ncbi:hypothetical protein [Nitrosomonas aestuarii]|uniref:hypothetical protein n=1 Tax=Nitrosomonas aestuarii TaxID=52441 RepID=UPI000D304528|nr:hypothetical protein [Nitrosomonas aestuarii]PTN12319.1 hypothetical protein C8R11_104103 [Nitrosomonas aestuarii]
MKHCIRSLISSFYLFVLLCSFNPVSAATTNEIETVFNWAESSFPELFPNHQATQMIDPWAFRFYPSTGVYAGVKNNDVFVLGGPWGTESPTFVGTLPDVLAQIQGSGGNGTVPACRDTAGIPPDMVITQSGNVVNITTNGQCILIPDTGNTNFCEPPAPVEPTGISILSTFNITTFQTTGIIIDLPGIPNPFDSLAQNTSSCIINAPVDATNLVVNSDICFDMTNQLSTIPSGFGITINPPVTVSTVSSSTSQQVPDCFATDAGSIFDAFTGETWVNLNGNFVSSTGLGTSF